MARTDETRERWLAALAAMDEIAAASGDPDYVAPRVAVADLGPLPADLAPRAREVQRAQVSAVERVQKAKRRVLDHLAALKTVPSARVREQSVYLDVTG